MRAKRRCRCDARRGSGRRCAGYRWRVRLCPSPLFGPARIAHQTLGDVLRRETLPAPRRRTTPSVSALDWKLPGPGGLPAHDPDDGDRSTVSSGHARSCRRSSYPPMRCLFSASSSGTSSSWHRTSGYGSSLRRLRRTVQPNSSGRSQFRGSIKQRSASRTTHSGVTASLLADRGSSVRAPAPARSARRVTRRDWRHPGPAPTR